MRDGTYEDVLITCNLKFIDGILHQLVRVKVRNDYDGEELAMKPLKVYEEWRKVPSETTS